MATIYNTDLSKELIDGANLQVSKDKVPTEIAEKVIPVIEVNPKLLRRCEIVRTSTANNATSTTLYTVPSDKDFYLVAANISVIKDATSTSTNTQIRIVINGATQQILNVSGITLTAQSETNAISFPYPIKVDSGSAITVNNSAAVANITSSGTIIGYTVDRK